MNRFYTMFLLLFGFCSVFYAQELPPIESYTIDIYNAENQNWNISQSADKHIYVANNKGLLEFNGEKWQLYPSPNQTILRSVHVVGDKIYTGCYMDFGYWERDAFSILKYKSLANKVEKPIIEDEEFWTILNFREWILFQSLNRIYIYNTTNDTFKIIESDSKIIKMYQIEDQIYFQKINEGLYTINNGEAVLLSSDNIFKTTEVVGIFGKSKDLIVLTNTSGFYKLNNENLIPWQTPSSNILDNKTIYSSIQLRDKSFLLGTISNGMIHLKENGEVLYQINQNSGLINNTVLSAFQDREDNIWLALDNGINCININSPFRIYEDNKGKIGTTYASAIFNDTLYLGTNQGLFYKDYNSEEEFKFIKGTNGQVWCLVEIDNQLFCGHNSGTFLINNSKAKLISNIQGTWVLKKIPEKPNHLLQGNYNGLNVIEKLNENWQFKNKIQGFNSSSRYFEFLNKNQILVSHEYKGVFNIKFNKDFTEVTSVVIDSTANKGLYSSLIKYKNDLLYTYKKGVFKYNHANKKFRRDSVLSQLFNSDNFISGKLIHNSKTDKLWGFSDKKITYISSGGLSKKPVLNSISLPNKLRKNITGFENITAITNDNYLFGTSKGYAVVSLSKLKKTSYEIEISSIKNSKKDGEFSAIDRTSQSEFENKHNNISFSFSVPEYSKYLVSEYQYQLKGFHEPWSKWTTNSTHIFENLPYGDYSFNVKARVGGVITKNVAWYSFTIQKPWYLSNLMLVLYIIIFISLSFLTHTFYKRYYKKQREAIFLKTNRELELKELENKQQLMSFNNEKLKQDIEGKNRELAISTMSLIKKNEFLNTIKIELNNKDASTNIKSVIKIIDKNINNTDDWKFFQEAFNNADKDFLKKLKTEHSALTPNDLKLCAYLRLNLSSKEIAPLLNISPRSVEVKRYRLRKKMNLPHETSLANYIIEL
ncbi:helix-turn-helix and ligand-binding sensor domain-containing protein [Lacinutrix jangbogonensis]|uniref:helix-turn-helix and ligand-binding sensor domain-containing protein n=1 Tax=Lacinutrix jangbogonensis TaxID=1469557 RepID=UPI00053F22AD|nr:LuxR C-terminal-related transcriptional regulator [Lacinutrix jangbogonensis]